MSDVLDEYRSRMRSCETLEDHRRIRQELGLPIPWCCHGECLAVATHNLYGHGPDDTSQACADHVEDLLEPGWVVERIAEVKA